MAEPIGIFGGTFDPIHFGHLRSALELKQALGLAEVRLIPASVPPHRGEPGANAAQRLAMVRAAVATDRDFVIDERELRREGPSYMADTLASLREEVGPERPLCLMLGMDAFLGLPGWHRWESIPTLAHLVVAHRPGWQLADARGAEHEAVTLLQRARAEARMLHEAPAGAVVTHPVTPLGISATAIRRLVAEGKSARYLLPDAVWDIIVEQRLYKDSQ